MASNHSSMTEITTFKGNWAEFPGTPTFLGHELLYMEEKMFERACAFARKFRELCRQTGFDFNKKYLVVENSQYDPSVDYDKIAEAWAEGSFEEFTPYPSGGRVGDMVWFECKVHADEILMGSVKARLEYLTGKKASCEIPLCDRWIFHGITLIFSMRYISIDGLHPCAAGGPWYLHCQSEPNSGCLQTMEEGFEELRREFLDNREYKLRPLSDNEVALFPNIDEEYCLSRVIPT